MNAVTAPDWPTAEQALASPIALLQVLNGWTDRRWIRDLDAAFADQLHALAPSDSAASLLAAMLVSQQAGQGHVLLDLQLARGNPASLITATPDKLPDTAAPPPPQVLLQALPSVDDWTDALGRWSAVGEPRDGNTPLVLDGHRLYLRRYWRHEQQVAAAITSRLQPLATDPATLRPVLDTLFPDKPDHTDTSASQVLACALGARMPLCVITGGPGTGKTTTVIRLLALLQVQALTTTGKPLEIRLAAPTGKAAARLSASIRSQIDALEQLPLPQAAAVRAAIPREVSTLHRLLGARPHTRRFVHHRHNPLPLDLVAVDEASMIDLDMMAALLDALPAHARLVLLGDKDQLASVEAGAVLGNLCARAADGHYRPDVADWLGQASGRQIPEALHDPVGQPLDQAIAMLRHSYRFDGQSGIGELARAVNAGNAQQALSLLDNTDFTDIHHIRIGSTSGNNQPLDRLVINGRQTADAETATGYRHYLSAIRGNADSASISHRHPTRPPLDAEQSAWDDWASCILDAHTRFQLLTPLRQGPDGVDALNQRIEQALATAGLIDRTNDTTQWYEGRPVLVTTNDYALSLMNGDIGITLHAPRVFGDPSQGSTLRVAFPRGDDSADTGRRIRWVLPSRLTRVETVYAMTVHKSQGSEFVHTALVMPVTMSLVLTRELLYTAITRARSAFTLLSASDAVLEQAIHCRTARQGRLIVSEE